MKNRKRLGQESSDLGDFGHSDLDKILSRTRLTVTRPTPDKNGVDYLLEAPPPIDIVGPGLDRRSEHPKLELQLKSTAEDRPSVRVKISRLETLVNSARPVVILIMHYDDPTLPDPNCVAMYWVHLAGDRLTAALKALRANGLNGKIATNEAYFTLTGRKNEMIEQTAAAIREKFHLTCGPSTDLYRDTKRNHNNTAGYPKVGRHSIKGQIAGTVTEVVDAFLGLGFIRVTELEQIETRFKLDERTALPDGKVKWSFPPMAIGHLVVSNMIGADVVKLPAEFRSPPVLVPKEYRKSTVTTAGMQFVVEQGKWRMDTLGPPPELTAREWAEHLSAADILCSATARLAFIEGEKEWLSWTSEGPATDIDMTELKAKRFLVEAAARLLDLADVGGAPLNTAAIIAQQDNIRSLDACCSGSPQLILEWKEIGSETVGSEGVLVVPTQVSDSMIAFALRFRLGEENSGVWRASSCGYLDATVIGSDLEGEVTRFAEKVRRISGLPLGAVLVPIQPDLPASIFGEFGGPGNELEFRLYTD